jgi:hypothetical protein
MQNTVKQGRPLSNPNVIVKRALSELSDNSTRMERADTLVASGANVLDMTRNAALLQIIIEDFSESRDRDELQLLFAATENVRKTAESVERIRASKSFTANEYQATINLFVGIIETLPEEHQTAALEMMTATSVRDLQNVTPRPISVLANSPKPILPLRFYGDFLLRIDGR